VAAGFLLNTIIGLDYLLKNPKLSENGLPNGFAAILQ